MEWISVEDRLPEDDNKLYLCTNGKEVRTFEFDGNGFYKGFHGQQVFYASVTHWMPLPEPPIDN